MIEGFVETMFSLVESWKSQVELDSILLLKKKIMERILS
jgi:hypothetical protein